VAPDATGFELELGGADLLRDEHGTVPPGIRERVAANRCDWHQVSGIRIPLRKVLYQRAMRTT
jgi:hypothetical protein